MLFLLLLVVVIHADVVRGDEPIYRPPDEHQNQNVRVKRAPDDGKSDAINATCVKNCDWRFSSCQNEVCTCNDGYEFVGDECRPAKDKNQQKQNIPQQDGCVFDSQCQIENSICENKECVCADGYALIGNKCESSIPRNDQTVRRSARLANDGYSRDFAAHLGRYCENDYNCGGHQSLNCDLNSKRCVCALGFNPTERGCIFSGIPGQRETPGQYWGKVHVNSNPTQYNPPERSISQPPGKDGNYRLTYTAQYPANPEGFHSGAYGHSCGSSADCKLDYLFCNPVRNRCECLKGFLYEYGNCVREVSLDIKPGYSTVKKSGTRSVYATYGSSCYANADCYSDALVCNVYTYQCVCSPRARLDGQYCVVEESFQTPTEYYKPTVTQQYNPGPNYPNPPPTVTGPNQQQNPGPYNPGFAPPYSPTRSHPVPPTNYNPNPNYNINYRQTPFRPYVDNRQHERRSVGAGKNYCVEDNQCRGDFTYCNKDSYRCECEKEYVEVNGYCVEENGIYCATDANCQLQYTYCRNNQCTCFSGYQRVGGYCVDMRIRDSIPYCNREEDCARLPYTKCFDGRCQCADSFSLVNGFCRRNQEKLDTRCNGNHHCDGPNTECDFRSNYCVCAEGYARYRQTCRQTDSLHGWCTVHGTCTSPDLECDRRNLKCECAFGSVRDWVCKSK